MLTRILTTLTLLCTVSTAGSEPMHAPAPRPGRLLPARIVHDVEGCRVPAPAPEPVAPQRCE